MLLTLRGNAFIEAFSLIFLFKFSWYFNLFQCQIKELVCSVSQTPEVRTIKHPQFSKTCSRDSFNSSALEAKSTHQKIHSERRVLLPTNGIEKTGNMSKIYGST